MKKELKRTKRAHLCHDKVASVKRGTKTKMAHVTIAIPDDLADRLIKNAMLGYFDADFACVGLMLTWTDVDYEEAHNKEQE